MIQVPICRVYIIPYVLQGDLPTAHSLHYRYPYIHKHSGARHVCEYYHDDNYRGRVGGSELIAESGGMKNERKKKWK